MNGDRMLYDCGPFRNKKLFEKEWWQNLGGGYGGLWSRGGQPKHLPGLDWSNYNVQQCVFPSRKQNPEIGNHLMLAAGWLFSLTSKTAIALTLCLCDHSWSSLICTICTHLYLPWHVIPYAILSSHLISICSTSLCLFLWGYLFHLQTFHCLVIGFAICVC